MTYYQADSSYVASVNKLTKEILLGLRQILSQYYRIQITEEISSKNMVLFNDQFNTKYSFVTIMNDQFIKETETSITSFFQYLTVYEYSL